MRELLGDPKVVEAAATLVVAILVGLAGLVAVIVAQIRRYMEAKFERILKGVAEGRAAAKSAEAEVKNSHDTNIRDDIDKAIETVWTVSDQVGELAAQVSALAEQTGRVETALDAHGKSLDSLSARVGRLDDRQCQLVEELHDERTAREAAQRTLDEHSHDTHARIWEQLSKIEEQIK